MSIKPIVLIFYFLLLVYNTPAQNHIIFNHLTVEQGLSQSSVTCIFQDSKGFMWFGTQDGLNRYDGYNIQVFKNNPTDSTSLSNNFVFSIYEDTFGNMYVETQGGIFQKYNRINESFTKLKKEDINFKGAKFNTVNAFFEDSNGVKWIGGMSAGTGLQRIDETSKIYIYKHNASDPSSLSDDKVYSVYRDHSGNLWVGTFNGLDKLDEKTGKFIHYKNKPGIPGTLSDNWVWPIFEDQQGYLWVGTVKGGLNKFNPRDGTFESYVNDILDPRSLSDNSIFSIYQDKSGIIWIGTNEGGLNYFLPSAQVFNLFRSKPGNKNWFADNTIQSMYADKNGNYWIGTRNEGLYKFDFKKDTFKRYGNNPSSSNSVSSNAIQTIYEDRSGILWIGNFSSGLDAFDPKTNIFRHYKNNPSDSNSISDNRIYSIIQDYKGYMWIGTYGGGLNKLDPRTGKITRFQNNKNDSSSISSNAVWSIAIDHSGKLWLGTFGGGINILDPDNGRAIHMKHDPNIRSSIIDNNIIRIFIDRNDNVWVGSTKGLSQYVKQKNKFINYREQDGLPNESVFAILEDNNGNLWISTNKGLSRFSVKDKSFKNYFSQDGLQGNEFNQNAFARDNLTGKLMFGGSNGFNVFDPDNVRGNNFIPPVVFTNYVRYNTDDNAGKPIFEKGISVRDSLLLSYKDNIINLQFAALNYYNTSENKYKYLLEGFNKNWIQLGNNNSVTFTNLSPGKYHLRVIGSNNDGVWNKKQAVLFIQVTPPWWKTYTAYTIYFIMFIGFLYLTRRIELKRREQKTLIHLNELRLKATVAEKRAIEIENERKTKELEEARQLQLSMLPKVLPKLPHLEISAFMRTATEVGGDYYDFILQDGGLLNIGFGDATGHGLQAGTMVTLMKGFFTTNAAKLGILDFMSHCSDMIREVKLGRILMSFTLLRIKDCRLELTNAGMPPVYYYNRLTKNIEEILIQGMPLGAMKKSSYQMMEKELSSGDVLLLLTDGLPEQMNSNEEMFDYSRVKEHFKEFAENEPDVIIEKLVATGDAWMGNAKQIDDITMIVIKVK